MKLKDVIERLKLRLILRKVALHHTACTSPHRFFSKPNRRNCVPYHFCASKTGKLNMV